MDRTGADIAELNWLMWRDALSAPDRATATRVVGVPASVLSAIDAMTTPSFERFCESPLPHLWPVNAAEVFGAAPREGAIADANASWRSVNAAAAATGLRVITPGVATMYWFLAKTAVTRSAAEGASFWGLGGLHVAQRLAASGPRTLLELGARTDNWQPGDAIALGFLVETLARQDLADSRAHAAQQAYLSAAIGRSRRLGH